MHKADAAGRGRRWQRFFCPTYLILATLHSACRLPPAALPSRRPDEAEIRSVLATFEAGWNRGDRSVALALWGAGGAPVAGAKVWDRFGTGRWAPPVLEAERPATSGREVGALLPGLMERHRPLRLGKPEIVVAGDRAEVRADVQLGKIRERLRIELAQANRAWVLKGWLTDRGHPPATLAAVSGWQQLAPNVSLVDAQGRLLDLYDVHVMPPTRIFVTGDNGVLIQTDDFGATWQLLSTGTAEHLRGIHFLDTQRGWVVGHNRTVLRTTDGGVTWQLSQVPLVLGKNYDLLAVRFIDEQHGTAVGQTRAENAWAPGVGVILYTTDGGATWQDVPLPWGVRAL